MGTKAEEIQSQIDALQQELHSKVEASDRAFNKQMNEVFEERRKAIAKLVQEKKLSDNMWGFALVALLNQKDKDSETTPHFLGPYDEKLLQQYLVDIRVEFTDRGQRVSLHFKPNPFFEETELWAETVEMLSTTQSNGEAGEDAGDIEETYMFSGITWKEGHGPDPEATEDEEDDDNVDRKRPRKEETVGDDKGTATATRGPSLLEVFSSMPPHPEDDEDIDEEDADFIAEAVDEWEEEMDDRRLLLQMIVELVHHSPLAVLTVEEKE